MEVATRPQTYSMREGSCSARHRSRPGYHILGQRRRGRRLTGRQEERLSPPAVPRPAQITFAPVLEKSPGTPSMNMQGPKPGGPRKVLLLPQQRLPRIQKRGLWKRLPRGQTRSATDGGLPPSRPDPGGPTLKDKLEGKRAATPLKAAEDSGVGGDNMTHPGQHPSRRKCSTSTTTIWTVLCRRRSQDKPCQSWPGWSDEHLYS